MIEKEENVDMMGEIWAHDDTEIDNYYSETCALLKWFRWKRDNVTTSRKKDRYVYLSAFSLSQVVTYINNIL